MLAPEDGLHGTGFRSGVISVTPFLNLSMSISESKATTTGVIASRQVCPARETSNAVNQPPIIDTIRVFIDKYPKIDGRRKVDIGHLPVHVITCLRTVTTAIDVGIHGDATDARDGLAAHHTGINIRWAFIDANILSVRANFSIRQKNGICVVRMIGLEIEPAIDPAAAAAVAAVVGWQFILVVGGVQDPGQGQLLLIPQTVNGLGADLGNTEGWQQ